MAVPVSAVEAVRREGEIRTPGLLLPNLKIGYVGV